jgi:hypothetical protein
MQNDENNPAVPPEDSLEGTEAANPSPSVPDSPPPVIVNNPPPSSVSKVSNLLRRLRGRANIYFLVFILLVIAAIGVIYMVAKFNKDSVKTNAGSLTDQQLSQLKGNTTLVGDAKQTLDVQSNAIFEGQVLVRSDLNVAGAIKVGSGLSINSINVSGNGNFGQLGVSGGLAVGGDTTLQGQLSVQKNLNVGGSGHFGSLAVSQLSVTSLQLQGNLSLSNHIVVSGGTPGRSNGTALGSGGTSSVSGNDAAGTVTINTGSSPPAGCFITVNFTQKYTNTPHVVISPSNSSAASIQYYTNRTTTSFSVCTANVPGGSTTYVFDYVIFG